MLALGRCRLIKARRSDRIARDGDATFACERDWVFATRSMMIRSPSMGDTSEEVFLE